MRAKLALRMRIQNQEWLASLQPMCFSVVEPVHDMPLIQAQIRSMRRNCSGIGLIHSPTHSLTHSPIQEPDAPRARHAGVHRSKRHGIPTSRQLPKTHQRKRAAMGATQSIRYCPLSLYLSVVSAQFKMQSIATVVFSTTYIESL